MTNPAAPLKLQYPISFGDRLITDLFFRRAKAKDMKNLPADPGMQTIALISRLTSEPPSVIDEMDATDLGAAGEILEDFLPGFRRTGNPSSAGSPID